MKTPDIVMKPCPFCGTQPEWMGTPASCGLYCPECQLESDTFEDVVDAATWWNTRFGEGCEVE